MSSFIKRVKSGMGAYTYAQLVTIVTQLLSLPVFLYVWDLETYGTWLILSAVPVYFAMSDFGMGIIAGNNMSMDIAQKRYKQANQTFQSALMMTSIAITFFLIIAITVTFTIEAAFLSNPEHKIVLLLLIAAALLSVLGGMVDAVFRANSEYATGTYLITTARLIEWVFSIIALWIFKDMLLVAAAYLLGRVLMTIFNITYATLRFKQFKWSFETANWITIKGMLGHSTSYMALPLGNAINLQGMTLIVGTMLGPTYVAVFNTFRTLSRLLLQAASILSKPLWPEFSRLYGLNEHKKILKIFNIGTSITFIMMILGLLFFYLFAELIIQYWTQDKIEFNEQLFMLMALSAAISGVAQIGTSVLGAINKHSEYFIFILIASTIVISAASFIVPRFDLMGAALIQVAYELTLLIVCIIFVYKKTSLKVNG